MLCFHRLHVWQVAAPKSTNKTFANQMSQAIIVVLLAAEIGLSTTSFTSGVHAYGKAPNSLPCLCLKGSPCRVRGLTMDFCPGLLMATTEPCTINVWSGAVAWKWLKRTSWLRVASLQATEALNPAELMLGFFLVEVFGKLRYPRNTRDADSYLHARAHPPRSASGTRGVPCRIVVSASCVFVLMESVSLVLVLYVTMNFPGGPGGSANHLLGWQGGIFVCVAILSHSWHHSVGCAALTSSIKACHS